MDYKSTGRILEWNHLGEYKTSCITFDEPTGERITIEHGGESYERTIYRRIVWRNMGSSTTVARFVIIDGNLLEIVEA